MSDKEPNPELYYDEVSYLRDLTEYLEARAEKAEETLVIAIKEREKEMMAKEKAEAELKQSEQERKNAVECYMEANRLAGEWQDENDELKAEVERLEDDNMWLMRQISMCRGRMSEKDVEAVCKQWNEWKAQKEGNT